MAIADLDRFSRGDLTETNYANTLRDRAIACGNVYGGEDLLAMYVAIHLESIQGSERQLYIDCTSATLDQLASHARNTANIQRRSISSLTSSRYSRTDATLLPTNRLRRQRRTPSMTTTKKLRRTHQSHHCQLYRPPPIDKCRYRQWTIRHTVVSVYACTPTRIST